MSSRIERMRDHHGSEIEEIEKRLRILRLRARFAASREHKMVERVESNKTHLKECYESRKPQHGHDLRALSNRLSRSLESRGGILDTGLCALPYHGFAERLFGSESEEEEYFFSDDDNSILEEDRSDEDDEMMSRASPPSPRRHVARLPQTERLYVAPSLLQAKMPDLAHTKKNSFRDLRPLPLIVARDRSITSPVPVRDLECTSTIASHARSMKTKPREHSSMSIKTSDTKKTWLNRLKCQSHADKDDIWIPKDIPHILQEYDNRHWNVCNDHKVEQSNVLRSKATKIWNQDDSSTIATYPSIELKQQRALRRGNQSRTESRVPSNASQQQRSLDGRSLENVIPVSQSRINPNRSISTGKTRSLQSSSGSGTRGGTMPNQGMPRVETGHSRKPITVSKSRSKTKKAFKQLAIDLRLSASDDSADPYGTVHFFQSGYGHPRTGTGAITSSWW